MPNSTHAPRIAIAPEGAPTWLHDAVVEGGGHVVEPHRARGLVWFDVSRPAMLTELLDRHEGIEWVQLPWAGVDRFLDIIDGDRVWTCAKGSFADPVAEMALTLALAGLRNMNTFIRSGTWAARPSGRSLFGARVTILGGGGICESLVRLLSPFDCHITVVRSHVQEMPGVDAVFEADRYVDALPGADVVVLALALTPETDGIIGRGELESMEQHAWLVNVARGRHVVTDDLVWALRHGVIAGAALDVVDPEPLPDAHPLWSLPNCIITPHTATFDEAEREFLAERIVTNVRRFAHGDALIGQVDPDLGY